ncbi:hypothetical protein, partial [Photobacterium halotolerans]|uniref:hypothetical protein n=1 Tax=Photobacterium halotolerans TaxID=265726 RepID=UPI000486A5A8
LPYRSDISIFVRWISGNGSMFYPQANNNNGKLRITFSDLSSDFGYGNVAFVARIYIVGRELNGYPNGKFGMVLYNDANRLVFTTESVMAPLRAIDTYTNGNWKTYPVKTANIMTRAYARDMGPVPDDITSSIVGFDAVVATNSGKPRLVQVNDMYIPGELGSGWNEYERHHFISIDTTYADRKFFGD